MPDEYRRGGGTRRKGESAMAVSENHLMMIQGSVTRMAGNCFLLKGWAVTLVVALFALGAADQDPRLALVAIAPTFMFWALDSYYLQQERLFRAIYDKVSSKKDDVDYAMRPEKVLTQEERSDKYPTWFNAARSASAASFYGVLLAVVLGVFILLHLFPRPQPTVEAPPCAPKESGVRLDGPEESRWMPPAPGQ